MSKYAVKHENQGGDYPEISSIFRENSVRFRVIFHENFPNLPLVAKNLAFLSLRKKKVTD